MMILTRGASLWGLEGVVVSVEVDAGRGLPAFHIVGQADRVIHESRDRIRAAFRRCGVAFPTGRVSVNLAPSELPKSGSSLDLAIAVAIAAASGVVPSESAREPLLIGELGFDGSLRPVRGMLALAAGARAAGIRQLVAPAAGAAEAALCSDLDVRAAPDLGSVLGQLRGDHALERPHPPAPTEATTPAIDLCDILGQDTAKRALEIAAAGGHHLIFVGPPGSGKTLLASRLPDLLPDLDPEPALEVTRIHGIAGPGARPVYSRRPPFRAPHHSVSDAGFAGGGRPVRPGELSLAHRGVLFLDELPEFRRSVLETLRQPLEHGAIHIARAHGAYTLPAHIQLVAAMNPCPCGFDADPTRECVCDPASTRRYRAKLSGPLIDRLDLHVSVPRLDPSGRPGASTEEVGRRVARVHANVSRNEPPGSDAIRAASLRLERSLRNALRGPDRAWLDSAVDQLGLSARASARVVCVARTIARLDGRDTTRRDDLAEALSYRWLDRIAAKR